MDVVFGSDAMTWKTEKGSPVPVGGTNFRDTALVCIIICSVMSCAQTGQDRVEIPFYVAGTDISNPVISVGDIPVNVERADLAFGPFYLCAGNTAGDLCDTARLEWLESSVIDTTSQDPVALGEISGVTGSVRSWMYDLAISSQLTHPKPYVLEAARDLGDSSFVIEGRALVDGVELLFFASVPIQQNDTTELGVPVIRKAANTSFFHEVTGAEERLTLRFDPSAWVSRIDFRPYFEDETCSPSGERIVCQGQTELTCDADGSTAQSRNCNELGQVCLAAQGCSNELILEEGSEAYRSLAIALTTTGRPKFDWTDSAP